MSSYVILADVKENSCSYSEHKKLAIRQISGHTQLSAQAECISGGARRVLCTNSGANLIRNMLVWGWCLGMSLCLVFPGNPNAFVCHWAISVTFEEERKSLHTYLESYKFWRKAVSWRNWRAQHTWPLLWEAFYNELCMHKRELRNKRHKHCGKAGFISSAAHRTTCSWHWAIIQPIMTPSTKSLRWRQGRLSGCSVTCYLTRKINFGYWDIFILLLHKRIQKIA